MKKLLIAAALATPAIGGIAVGAHAIIGQHGPVAADTNKDGTISFAEASAASTARFKAQDDNGDGKLTGEELRQRGFGGRGRGEMGGMLRQADTNQDGKISRDELRISADRLFDRLDANHDGSVDQAEMNAMRGPRRGEGRYPGGIGAAGDDIPPPPPLPNGQ